MKQLKEIANYVSDKIDVKSMSVSDYISTDNMLPQRGGIIPCTAMTEANRVTQYLPGDVLVSNIRPYFKKIWFANRVGGCSNDVIVFRVFDESSTYPKYLYYLLSQDIFFDYMMAGSNGTKMPRGNKKLIPEFTFNDVDIEKQKLIADILSAYDDLIENNKKQIKLLEEAAMRLYKEWFVHLRFPDHETTKIIDGVPEGWQLGKLKELVEVKYGKDHKKVADGDIPVYGSGGLMRKCNMFLHDGESVLIPRKGSLNHIMYVNEKFWTVDTMFFTQMKCNNIALYIYFFMCSFDMYSMNIGAAVPSMTTNTLNGLDVLIPEETLLESFDNSVKICFQRIAVLKNQNEKAKLARDKLLPKLMSGEIKI